VTSEPYKLNDCGYTLKRMKDKVTHTIDIQTPTITMKRNPGDIDY
jgi:hypothetical protein